MATIEITIDDEQIEALSEAQGLAGLLRPVLNQVLKAEMTDHLGAGKHERTDERTGQRNGYYERDLVTRVGPLEWRVPRDRDGTFNTELFERYQRSEKALVLALMEMVVNGVSTRKVKSITEKLCGHEFKKSTVSDLSKDLNEQVEGWNERPLDGREFPFVLVDAMQIKVRRGGAVRPTSANGCRRHQRGWLPRDSRSSHSKFGVEAKLAGLFQMAQTARSQRRRGRRLGRP